MVEKSSLNDLYWYKFLIHMNLDSDLNFMVHEDGADPLVFIPMVDFSRLKEPSIINVFWKESVFFWSEDHAREHRRDRGGVTGLYLTLSQSAYLTKTVQSEIFAFSER
jgi:hypothetical protein